MLFLDVIDNFHVLSRAKVMSLLGQKLDKVLSDITTSHFERLCGVFQGVALVQWHTVRDGVP